MQTLETETITNDSGHFIKSFLISTKPNEAGWQVTPRLAHKIAVEAEGKDFIIVPELINKPLELGGGGHYFGSDTYEDLMQGYSNHSHGKFVKSSGPFYYNDGTQDFYYMANIKLRDSKAASALLQYGPKTWTPFAVSPHIWPLKQKDNLVYDAHFIGSALVIKGAYGDDAVITHYCKGENKTCDKSLSASICCDKEDSLAANIVSSLVINNDTKGILATVQEFNPATNQPKQEQPIQEQKQEQELKNINIPKEDYERLLKEVEAKKEQDQQLQQLITENKTTKLNNIFKSVKDESLKKTLTEKYFNADVNQLNEFYADITNHVFPSLVDEAKAQAEQDLKNKTIDENKGKSKAGSLAKEPEVPKDESKAGSIVPKLHNEVKRFEQLMRGGI